MEAQKILAITQVLFFLGAIIFALAGGWVILSAGDINKCTQDGYNNYWTDWCSVPSHNSDSFCHSCQFRPHDANCVNQSGVKLGAITGIGDYRNTTGIPQYNITGDY